MTRVFSDEQIEAAVVGSIPFMARCFGDRSWWTDQTAGYRVLLISWRGVVYLAREVAPKGGK